MSTLVEGAIPDPRNRRGSVEMREAAGVFPACRLVQPSNRGGYGINEAVELLIRSGRASDALPVGG